MKTPDLTAVTLASGTLTADVADAVTEVTLDYGTDTVAQLTITVTDPKAALPRSLTTPGTALTWQGEPWQIAARSSAYGSDATLLRTFTARSTLARALRRRYKASAEKKVSPTDWVTRRVIQASGRATCQPSAKQGTIAQPSGRDRQSDLDVIANLASDLQWSWVEWGGRLFFGSRHWAWQTGPTGRTWPVTWRRDDTTDALTADLTEDDDDTDNYLTGSLELPYRFGKKVRPWDRLQTAGLGVPGLLLVEQVQITADGTSNVRIQVAQPRPPAKKAGSSS